MEITEFESLDPERVDAVGFPANGISFLMIKTAATGANPQFGGGQDESSGADEAEEATKAQIQDQDDSGEEAQEESTATKFAASYCGDIDCDVCKERLEILSDEDAVKAKLNAKRRKAIPSSTFALPGRKYPIHDRRHARNALARVSQFGTPEEKAKVRAAVRRKYPTIKVKKEGTTDYDSEVWAHLEDARDAVNEAMMDQAKDNAAGAAKQTAPNKSVPRTEAESQTHWVDDADEAPGPGGPQEGGTPSRPSATNAGQSRTTGQGNTAPNKAIPREEAEGQTRALLRKQAVDEALSAIQALFRLGNNEKAAAKAVATLTRSFTKSGLIPSAPEKEITQMTKGELFKLMDEREKARRKAAVKKAKKAKKARAEKKAQKAAQKAAQADVQTAQADPAVKGALDDLQAQVSAVRDLVAKPAMPYLNGAAVAAQRGQATPSGEDAFKGLRDRIEAEQTDRKRKMLAGELLRAQAIAAEQIRVANGARPGVNTGPVPVVLPG